MKKMILILGIVLIVVSVLALLTGLFSWYSYYHVLDGSGELFARLHRRAIVFTLAGVVLAVLGIVGLIVRAKM